MTSPKKLGDLFKLRGLATKAASTVRRVVTLAERDALPLLDAAMTVVPEAVPGAASVHRVVRAASSLSTWSSRSMRSEYSCNSRSLSNYRSLVEDILAGPKIVRSVGPECRIFDLPTIPTITIIEWDGRHRLRERDSEQVLAFFRSEIDRKLPREIEISRVPHNIALISDEFETHPWTGCALRSPMGDRLADHVTTALKYATSRTVMLHGPPGTGKSVMAAWIAQRVSRSRVVFLDAAILEDGVPDLALLGIDVCVVDELDKYDPKTENMDKLRASTRLVIYTANNGTDARAVDGAISRPGRIDESWEVLDIGTELATSSDVASLPADLRDEIAKWPAAAINEVHVRIKIHGPDPELLRLDEIRSRLAIPCLSSGKVNIKVSLDPQ